MSRSLVPLRARLACWLLLVSLAVACARPQPPRVTPRVVQVAGVSPRGLDLDVQLGVHNPNRFAISAEAVSGSLFVGQEQRLGRGEAHPRQPIPARAEGLVQSRVHVDWADLAALVPLLHQERVPYEFRGDVTLGSESWNVTLPFSLRGELTRSELIRAGLRGF